MNFEIENYIKKQPSPQKEILKKIQTLIKESIPSAQEEMGYGVLAFKLHKNKVYYAGFANHIGLYPDPNTMIFFKKELKNYETSKGTIKFKTAETIPYDLIVKIVKYKLNKK